MPKQAINPKDWTRGVVTLLDPNDSPQLTNVDIDRSGAFRPRKSWKTFAGMVHQLWLINKRFQKLGVDGDFTVRLPLPSGNYKRNR